MRSPSSPPKRGNLNFFLLFSFSLSCSVPFRTVLLLHDVKQGLYLYLLPPPHLCQIRHDNHKGVVEGNEADKDCDVAVAVGEGVAVLYVLKGRGNEVSWIYMSWE